jgi:predicted O-linked N-acetylglucosamine transferase (SPINDLY family)
MSVAEAIQLWRDGRHEEAERLCEQLSHDDSPAGAGRSSHARLEALSLLAEIYSATRRTSAELATLRELAAARPGDASVLRRLGNALLAEGSCIEAVTSYRAALAIEPGNVRAHNNLGQALVRLSRTGESMACFRRAIELDPRYVPAHNNLGIALHEQGNYETAVIHYRRALELQPSFAEAHNNCGNALLQLNRVDQALGCYEQAVAVAPTSVDALANLGNTLNRLKRYEEAAQVFDRLLALAPDYKLGLGLALGARLACCDWNGYADSCARILRGVQDDKPVVHPFTFLAISDSPELQLRCARRYESQSTRDVRRPWIETTYLHDRIRVAYLSADYYDHATAALTAGLFEAHDRLKFETIAISYGPDDSGAMRRRLERAFDRFIDVRHMGDADVVQLMRSLQVDIAVDLKGHTTRRLGLMMRRPAPIQVNYLGYPGTMGLEEIDYILADPVILPPSHQVHYSEAVVYLPESYQVNDDRRPIAAHTPSRPELGLPDDAFVFCCFNNHYKITPMVFDIWMRLLQQIPGSVLWLLEDNAAAAHNLRREAKDRGVSAERLVFATRTPSDAHLARHRQADLFLDTLPYNAHTTASDALWAGLPVLTCLGTAFPGRVAASLLRAVGLPELVAHSHEEYEERALELASDPHQLRQLRARLGNRASQPLFDTARFCTHLETAYTTMWQRHQAGLPPEGFAVPVVTET